LSKPGSGLSLYSSSCSLAHFSILWYKGNDRSAISQCRKTRSSSAGVALNQATASYPMPSHALVWFGPDLRDPPTCGSLDSTSSGLQRLYDGERRSSHSEYTGRNFNISSQLLSKVGRSEIVDSFMTPGIDRTRYNPNNVNHRRT